MGCVEAWAGDQGRALLASLVVLYAIESAQPRISEVKRAGLVEHAERALAANWLLLDGVERLSRDQHDRGLGSSPSLPVWAL